MRKRDLTRGSIYNNLIYMSLPAMLGAMAQNFYSLVDMVWVGRLSAEAVASITIFSSLYFIIYVVNNIIGYGSVPIISQSFGSGNKSRTEKAIASSFVLKLMVGTGAAVFTLLIMKPVMGLFTDEAIVLQGAMRYGLLRTLFMPVVFSSLTIQSALRCSGDSKSPMFITIAASVINMVLDPIFMFETIPFLGIKGLGLGLFGVALATIISNTFSFIVGYKILFGSKSSLSLKFKDLHKPNFPLVKEIFRVGTPPACAGVVRNIAYLIILRFTTIYGTAAIATWGILTRLFGLLFMPIEGLLNGGSAMIGQNIGSREIDRANKTAKASAVLGGLSMLILGIFTCLFAPNIMKLFIDDLKVIEIGAPALRIVSVSLIPIGFYFGLATIFIGSGYTLPLLISGFVGQWLIQLPFVYLVTRVWNLSFIWVAWSFIFYTISEGSIVLYYYLSNKWKRSLIRKMAKEKKVS